MAAGGLSPDPAGAGGALPAKLGLARRAACAGISLSALPDIRYRGQRHTTVMARLSRPFVSEALRPEFQELQQTLAASFDALTVRVIKQALEV